MSPPLTTGFHTLLLLRVASIVTIDIVDIDWRCGDIMNAVLVPDRDTRVMRYADRYFIVN